MTYLLTGDVDGGAVQMYYNLFEFTAPATSRLLLVNMNLHRNHQKDTTSLSSSEEFLEFAWGGYGPKCRDLLIEPQTCN